MQEQDIQAWERELNHSQMMQKQREGWDGKQSETWVGSIKTAPAWTYSANHSDELNEEQDNEK